MAQYENMILDAVEIIVQDALNKAGYDKTIRAVIESCVDPTIGKYRIKYQDSMFFAYAINSNIRFQKGTMVQVLIPRGDMSQTKTILGAENKTIKDYSNIDNDKNRYTTYGKNCVNSSIKQGISSYHQNNISNGTYDYKKIIYSITDQIENQIDFDADAAEKYISKSNYLMCGVNIRTELNKEQKLKGNYGIGFVLDFHTEDQDWSKTYLLDINNMSGDPYNFLSNQRQYNIFAIDGSNFVQIREIFLFTKGFPNQDNTKTTDIYFSDLEITGANKLSEEELNGYFLDFDTPNGLILKENSLENIQLQAKLRINGEPIETDTLVLGYYWFRQNNTIDENSLKYNRYGGIGWECLNKYKEIIGEEQVEWIPDDDLYTINFNDFNLSENIFKCVVLCLNGTLVENEIILYKEYLDTENNYKAILSTSSGRTSYHYGDSNDTIVASIKKGTSESELINGFDLYWASVDNNGNTSILPTDNEIHGEKIIAAGEIIDRIKYSCTLYSNNNYIGTINILLYNMDYMGDSVDKNIFSLRNVTKEQRNGITEIQTQYTNLSGGLEGITSEVNSINEVILPELSNQVNDINSSLSSYKTEIKQTMDSISARVEEVSTEVTEVHATGMSLDNTGLHVTDSNADTYTTIDATGLFVTTQDSDNKILKVYAEEGIGKIDADNINIKSYTKIGYSQIENTELDGEPATGIFWVG